MLHGTSRFTTHGDTLSICMDNRGLFAVAGCSNVSPRYNNCSTVECPMSHIFSFKIGLACWSLLVVVGGGGRGGGRGVGGCVNVLTLSTVIYASYDSFLSIRPRNSMGAAACFAGSRRTVSTVSKLCREFRRRNYCKQRLF